MKLLRDKGSLGLVLGILVAVGVAIFQSVGWDKLIPLLSVAVLALVFLSIFANAEDRITKELDQRLPRISYLNLRKEVESALFEIVKNASEFIVTTGGRSRNRDYLKAIETKVREGKILYWRIIYEESITYELCEHLCSLTLLPNVTIVRIKDTSYGNMTITDNGLLIALPVPGHGELKGINIPSSEYAQNIYNNYMMIVFSKSEKIETTEEIINLCETKDKERAQQRHAPDRQGRGV